MRISAHGSDGLDQEDDCEYDQNDNENFHITSVPEHITEQTMINVTLIIWCHIQDSNLAARFRSWCPVQVSNLRQFFRREPAVLRTGLVFLVCSLYKSRKEDH